RLLVFRPQAPPAPARALRLPLPAVPPALPARSLLDRPPPSGGLEPHVVLVERGAGARGIAWLRQHVQSAAVHRPVALGDEDAVGADVVATLDLHAQRAAW